MAWGIFEMVDRENSYSIHIVPVDKNFVPKRHHVPNEFCYCDPIIDVLRGKIIVKHNEEQ